MSFILVANHTSQPSLPAEESVVQGKTNLPRPPIVIFQPHSRATLFSLHSKPHQSPPCISPTDIQLVVRGMTNLPDLSTSNTIIVSLTPYYIPITHYISTNTLRYFHLQCIHSDYQTWQVIIHILHVCECVCAHEVA